MSENNPVDAAAEQMAQLRAELREQSQLADLGELAGQINHKFNNFLNSLLLKIALLETELGEPIMGKFAEIKQQAKSMADVIKQIHAYQRRATLASGGVDLNATVSQVGDSMARAAVDAAITLHIQLSARPPLISGSPVDLQRLCYFLLRNRLSAGRPGGTLVLRTAIDERALLVLEDPRASMTAADAVNLFEVDAHDAEGGCRLDLAACKTLVRRNQGRISSRLAAGGAGLIIEAEFPLLPGTS